MMNYKMIILLKQKSLQNAKRNYWKIFPHSEKKLKRKGQTQRPLWS